MTFRDFLNTGSIKPIEITKDLQTHVFLHKLNNNGAESKMQSDRKVFESEELAIAQHDIMVKLNPTKNVRHNLYLRDGTVRELF